MTETLPFTNNDIKLVQNSWKLVRGDISGVGVAIFMKMFEQHPDYLSLFKKFSHVPIIDLPGDKVFVNHAIIVAKALDDAILVLNNLDNAKNVLIKIGTNHFNKNMNANHFIHCNDATIIVLQTALKEKFNKEVEEAWNKVLPIVATLIAQGMRTGE